MTRMDRTPLVLVADIGGTNTRVALAEGGRLRPGSIRRFANAGRPALEPILTEYLRDAGLDAVDGACVAAAGPVRDGVAQMTNLAWMIEAQAVADVTGAGFVAVLNDLQAQGHALGHLAPGMVRELIPGAPARPGSSQLVIGVGTGFNAAPVHEGPGGRVVPAAESGHVTLPCITESDFRLKAYLEGKHAFASVEHVVSGRGIERIYAYLAGHEEAIVPGTEIIAAIAAGDAIARAAGRLFVEMLGRVTGDLALTHLPFGGIYLIGGAARGFVPWFEEFGFAQAMHAKGRFSDFLAAFPVRVIEDDYAALAGCAAHLQARMAAA